MREWKDREIELQSLAKQFGFSEGGELVVRQKLSTALQLLADKETAIDSGISHEGFDFWATINGKEYFITAKVAQPNSEAL